MKNTLRGTVAGLTLASIASCAPQGERHAGELAGTIRVPIDRSNPRLGDATLDYELGAPFDPAKPIVIVVADGQQFFVRHGAMPKLQEEISGGEANVVGLIGRGATEAFVAASLDAKGEPDWPQAWRIFRAEEWIEDLDALRMKLAGPHGRVILYGRSGGAYLVHQYLARHGAHVERAYTGAAVQPFIVGELGLNTDRFWEEIAEHDGESQALLAGALAAHPEERFAIAMLLQRQNFFVQPADLARARAELIAAIARGDEAKLAAARKEYQVDEVMRLYASNDAIPIRVREFELAWPAGERGRLGGTAFRPDLEVHYAFGKPLFDAADKGAMELPHFDFAALHRLDADVLVIAGRRDHTVDYRTSIALAAHYSRGRVIILDDDHMLSGSKSDGTLPELTRAFLLEGPASPRYQKALAALDPHRWRE